MVQIHTHQCSAKIKMKMLFNILCCYSFFFLCFSICCKSFLLLFLFSKKNKTFFFCCLYFVREKKGNGKFKDTQWKTSEKVWLSLKEAPWQYFECFCGKVRSFYWGKLWAIMKRPKNLRKSKRMENCENFQQSSAPEPLMMKTDKGKYIYFLFFLMYIIEGRDNEENKKEN